MIKMNILKEIKKFFLGFLILVMLGIASPIFALEHDNNEKIKIGYYENERFQEGGKDGSQKSGYSYEYLQKIASINGWKYEYVYGTWSNLYNQFINGEIDLLAGLGYSENRLQYMNYPEYPMGYESYFLYARDGDHSVTLNPNSLNGKKIGAIDGLMENVIRQWIDQNKINAEIVIFEDIASRDEALISGKIDAFIGESSSVSSKDNIEPLLKIHNVNMYLCVAKSRTDLLEELNDALARIDTKEPYFIFELSKKYFNNNAISSSVSVDEEKFLTDHGYTVVVGYLDNFMPYSGTDENGAAVGVIVDVLNAGFKNLKTDKPVVIKFQAFDSANAMISAINRHEIDVMFPLSNDLDYLENHNLYGSKSVISSAMYFVYKQNADRSEQGKIAINKNNQIQYNYVHSYFGHNPIIICNSTDECLHSVLDGTADGTILSGLRATALLKDEAYSQLSYAELPNPSVKIFGVSNTVYGLLPLVNQALNTLDDNVAMSFINKYVDHTLDSKLNEFIKNHRTLLYSVLFISLLCVTVLIAIIRVKQKKQQLFFKYAYKDGLTRLFNRRAYEEELRKYVSSVPKNLICVSMDLTGLKNANDTYGHLAGDELIKESANLLTKHFGDLGNIYRTGGDEFYALLVTAVANFKSRQLLFQRDCDSWVGNYSKQMNVAMGFATPADSANNDIIEIEKIADARMYEAKSNWYAMHGVDRRGVKIGFEAVCKLYSKILKINITTDTFSILNVLNDENSEKSGYSNKISEWLRNFAKLGNVHPDDTDYYLSKTDIKFLRDYFKNGNSSLSITYRRKINEQYKAFYMEIFTADDYDHNNQTLFLTVKQILDNN